MPPAGSRSQLDVREALSRAAASAKSEDFAGAIAHLKELLAVEPDHEIANGMLAGIYAQIGMPERATEHFQRVLAINPQNPLARLQLEQLQQTGGTPEAGGTNRGGQ
jgi:predicted Zn-dependent protease